MGKLMEDGSYFGFGCTDPFRLDSQSLVIRMFFSSWYRESTFLMGNFMTHFR